MNQKTGLREGRQERTRELKDGKDASGKRSDKKEVSLKEQLKKYSMKNWTVIKITTKLKNYTNFCPTLF